MPSAVVDVMVEREPDGALLVAWEVEGDPVAVDIACGPSPDRLDHAHRSTAPADARAVRLEGLEPGRHFVSVAPHAGGPAAVGADRRVHFDGITNFRDLGGYRTSDGGRTRWGLVFRADALHDLSAADLVLYGQLGLQAVWDLRGDAEREERPNPVASRSVVVLSRPEGAEPVAATDSPRPASTTDGEAVLANMYLGIIEHSGHRVGEVLEGLAEAGALPAVFHCHAGKDRTGVIAALLLDFLGVDRQVVLDDYELTARYRFRHQQESSYERLVAGGMAPEAAAAVLTTPRWAMEQALAVVDTEHGGVESYLTDKAGLEVRTLATLRRLLVER